MEAQHSSASLLPKTKPEQRQSEARLITMLQTALGETAGRLLVDDSIIEIMLNPDGRLWVDSLEAGRSFTGFTMSPEDAERVIYIVSSAIGATCTKETPVLSAELPINGSRFQGILPPVVAKPIFTIRKKAIKVFTLDDYVSTGILKDSYSKRLTESVIERKNILIIGGTGSGKTTLANAILSEIAATKDRVVIIEDTQELQCEAEDSITLRTKDGVASMRDLLKATMRLRPDRIVIGEVRGAEALDLLKAWNTGHPGGCATVHADSALKGLTRLEQLVQEAGVSVSRELIAEAVNVVLFIEKHHTGRVVKEMCEVLGYENGKYVLKPI